MAATKHPFQGNALVIDEDTTAGVYRVRTMKISDLASVAASVTRTFATKGQMIDVVEVCLQPRDDQG